MKAHELKAPVGSTHRSRRVGRGHSAGQGKTSGRGVKGQGSRSGGVKAPYFEGGQLPFSPVNVQELDAVFADGDAVTVDLLVAKGLVKSAGARVKVLGDGELQKKLNVQAHAFSASAKEKIEKAGGATEVISH